MKDAVKTEERAIQLLNLWLAKIGQVIIGTAIESITAKCECGLTSALQYITHDGRCAYVAICDGCGDDDRLFEDTVENLTSL